MANVWKIGSRWDDYGNWSKSIISIFRRSEAVFIGSSNAERFNNEVKVGDYFAIADGYSVKAVAKAVSVPMPLNEMINKNMIRVRQNELSIFDIKDDYSWCYGVKVKIVDLPDKLQFSYNKPGAFFRANDKIAKEVIKLFDDNLTNEFDILASTYRIKNTLNKNNDGKRSIINDRSFYNIPIYQREYSWGNGQVSKLINDIFNGFWGVDDDKTIRMEPLFIGTMQLSYKKFIQDNEYEQDVIDGQQRLSTILCIIKYLKLKYPQDELIHNVSEDWLETRVNNGIEEKYLLEMLNLTTLDNIQDYEDYALNHYLQNIDIVRESFEENTCDDNGKELPFFNSNLFIKYFLNDIYFVVVETVAGLSKTIQIFNSINTAGLDLSGNDVFKVRFYEYLHDIKGKSEDAFNSIGDVYKDIKDKNEKWFKSHGKNVLDIGLVISIYQKYIISKYKLPTSLYSKATDTFFNELFDTLLHVKNHKDMKSVSNRGVELSVDDLKKIAIVVYLWNRNKSEPRSANDFISYKLIDWSRYSRYLDIAYLILLNNEGLPTELRISQVYEVLSALSKLFFCYSIRYAKSVYEVHSFMFDIFQEITNFLEEKDNIINRIKVKTLNFNNPDFKENYIGGYIADNRIRKSLICILSDYIEENSLGIDFNEYKEMYDFFDVEHIHANANEEEGMDIDDSLQNSIGNLMLLEPDINRSIGCLPFREKVNRTDKKLCYRDSKYATVKKIMNNKEWGLSNVINRRNEEIERISSFLFS